MSETMGLVRRVAQKARKALASDLATPLERIAAISILDYNEARSREHVNPLNKYGNKVFSQTDEDGITFEIIKRLGIQHGVFAEFGVGTGLENNTILLASLGWSGFWVGGEKLAYTLAPTPYGEKMDFSYLQEFITTDNIVALAKRGLQSIAEIALDVISLDLDGNDYYFVEELLKSRFSPKLFMVEYNSKFMPPIRWKIQYDPQHRWGGDDYFGASLMEFADLFEEHGYFLACCNSASGSNAFFVQAKFRDAFRDVPEDVHLLWSPPRYNKIRNYGHTPSAKTVALIMSNIAWARRKSSIRAEVTE
jgi:hypothetical protein